MAGFLTGCTPAMHRSYQYTMAGAAVAGWGTATYLTYENVVAQPEGPYTEMNPVLGNHPGVGTLAAAQMFNAALLIAIELMPDSWFDGGAPWVKDGLMTAAASMAVADGYGDYLISR